MLEYIQKTNGNKPEEQLADIQKQIEEEQLADIQKQIEEETISTKYLVDVIGQIRQSLKKEDILKTTVREVHTILNCDRALVYTLNHDSYGVIVAESVSYGWTNAEGRIIQDPCFEARYIEQYRDGRVRAWSNIYEAGMSRCYIEQLERLEVKANIVVPIVSEGKLFGLLVAQQCSAPRQWKETEIVWLTQIAIQVGFALENAKLIADARQLRQQIDEERKWRENFSDTVKQIRQRLKTKDILNSSVREVRRLLNCDRVVVYSLDRDDYGTIVAESVAHGWIQGQGRVIKDPCFEARYLEQYRDGRVRAWSNIYEAGMSKCYIEQLEKLEVKANLVSPIINKGKVFGLLVAHQCSDTRQWQESEIHWLGKIATQVGFALENAQLLEQLMQSTQATQEILDRAVNSSSNIQRTVQNLGVELENLSNSCQNFSETVDKIGLLSKHIAQQAFSLIKTVDRSQIEQSNQNSVIDISNKTFALIQKLFETSAKIEPLFNDIKIKLQEKKNTINSEAQQLTNGVDDFQTASQLIEQITTLNHEISNLSENISHSLETQIQGSTFTKDSVDELAEITERISQQSVAVVESFSQLRGAIE